YIR
ncbi:unnamed protein product, partial [Allacma fusca]